MKRHTLIAVDSVRTPKICSVGFSKDPEVTRFGPSVRNQYIIHYVLSGEGIFNGNRVEKGQGFLISPNMHEEYYPDPNDPWSFLWVISEDPVMRHFFELHNASAESGIFTFSHVYEIERIVERLDSIETGFSSSAELSEIFLHIFNSSVASERNSQSSTSRLYFEFSVNYVKTNLHLKISVDELCRAIGITQPYLYRIFKEATGSSPKRYIMDCKLAEAKRLLAETELSVTQIADSVGYGSVLDFSKFFSKHTKASPTDYRLSHSLSRR